MGTTEHHKKPDDKLRHGGRGEGWVAVALD